MVPPLMSSSLCVAVGSTNPVKIEAVRDAFTKVFYNDDKEAASKKLTILGSPVSSGVSDQPLGGW